MKLILFLTFCLFFLKFQIQSSKHNLSWATKECRTYWNKNYTEFKKSTGINPNAESHVRTIEQLRIGRITYENRVLICPKYQLVYVVNEWSGDSTFYELFSNLNCSIQDLTTRNLNQNVLANYFFFSFVRHPINRFITGYKQMMVNGWERVDLFGKSISQVISEYNRKSFHRFLNTQTYFLSSRDYYDNEIPLHFIGKIERFEEDIIELFHILDLDQKPIHLIRQDEVIHLNVWFDSRIYKEDAEKLCEYLAQDFICFEYEIPVICQNFKSQI